MTSDTKTAVELELEKMFDRTMRAIWKNYSACDISGCEEHEVDMATLRQGAMGIRINGFIYHSSDAADLTVSILDVPDEDGEA